MNIKLNTKPIFDYIKENGLTKKAFCKSCGISVSILYRIASGKTCKAYSLLKISKEIGVSLSNLIVLCK